MTHVISLNTGRSYPLELIQLDQLLVTILQTYEQRIKQENRTLEVNFSNNIDAFYQYRPPLERILTNLLENALKFSNYGSRIDIIISENEETIVSTSQLKMKVLELYLNFNLVFLSGLSE